MKRMDTSKFIIFTYCRFPDKQITAGICAGHPFL